MGRVQGPDQVRRGRHQEFGRPPRGHDHRRIVPQRIRRRLSMGASRHRRDRVHRVGSRHGSARADGCARGNVCRIRTRARALRARGSRSLRRVLLVIGLGLLAGAVSHRSLGAQVIDTIRPKVPLPPDSLKPRLRTRADTVRDSLFRVDSIRRERIRADSIKSPIAHAESPPALGAIGQRQYWPRDSLFGTGSLTVADLLERVAGVSNFRGGWLPPPQVGSYLGDVRRVRVFFDGFELKSIDPRTGGVLDLTQINLWSAEDAAVEQTADEIRVYLRSWRVRNTHTETRTDVSTGDQQTNLYRGFLGTRLNNGGAFQFGAQQYGTTPPAQFGSSSDQVGLVLRAGWAKQKWSIDALGNRIGRHRGVIIGEQSLDVQGDSIPQTSSTGTDAYVRVGYADPDEDKMWAQVMAGTSTYRYTGIRSFVGF